MTDPSSGSSTLRNKYYIESEQLSLIAIQQSGLTTWTGGAFGPEGGLIVIFAALLGMLLVYGRVCRTHRRASVQADLAQYMPCIRKEKRQGKKEF